MRQLAGGPQWFRAALPVAASHFPPVLRCLMMLAELVPAEAAKALAVFLFAPPMHLTVCAPRRHAVQFPGQVAALLVRLQPGARDAGGQLAGSCARLGTVGASSRLTRLASEKRWLVAACAWCAAACTEVHPCRRCLSSVPQVYRDSDLLLGSYNVPLEYDPDLIAQVTAAAPLCLAPAAFTREQQGRLSMALAGQKGYG